MAANPGKNEIIEVIWQKKDSSGYRQLNAVLANYLTTKWVANH